MSERVKFFIFSDESGSWHDEDDIYVRAWIVISKKTYEEKLLLKIDQISSFMNDAKELKWSGFANSNKYFKEFNDIEFGIFITISSPKDINWEGKYNVTKNFKDSVDSFDFGEIDDEVVIYLKDRMYRDIKNALFLNYYEKLHIENAKNGIERIIKKPDYDLIYRVDPPQLPHEGWRKILENISDDEDINLEFPKSIRTQGIQFADLIAGSVRSFMIKDKKKDASEEFLREIKSKLISKNKYNPNPNLIMYSEINSDLIDRSGEIWKL